MAVQFTLFADSTTGGCTLSPVKVTKNENGYYNATKTTVPAPNALSTFGTGVSNMKTIGAINKFFVPVHEKTTINETNYIDLLNKSFANDHLVVSCKIYTSDIDKILGKKYDDFEKLKIFINAYLEKTDYARYLLTDNDKLISQGKLRYAEHKRGNWHVTRKCTYWAYSGSYREGRNLSDVITDTFNSSSNKISAPKSQYSASSFEKKTGKNYSYSHQLIINPNKSLLENQVNNDVNNITWKLHSTLWEISLTFGTIVDLAPANTWEVGAVCVAPRTGSNYCFYSTDKVGANYLSYFKNAGCPVVLDENKSKLHSCTSHGGSADPNDLSIYMSSSTTINGVTYGKAKLPVSSAGTKHGEVVKHLSYGTKGTYVDGVATLPYVIIELRGNERNSDSTDYHSLSIPANSFVSLTHERNLGDGYNTFSLQMFDKDALQVESWLLLGFRYITFYYTDFVSTSKRFKGQVLDYKTVITGKGLMLTLSGYTSNADIYTGKDSIPWSKLVEARSFSFFYWLNEAGEYHGELRHTVGKLYEGPGQPKENADIYNSTEGIILSPATILNNSRQDYNTVKDAKYCLLAPSKRTKKEDGEEQEEQTTEWWTYDAYYAKASQEDLDKYRPKVKEWSLDSYGYNMSEILSSHTQDYWTEPRPSNIVILIAIINGWKVNLKYITRTRKVTEIPDQVSMSFTEYIKKNLIPISISETGGATQFYLWFDDEGYVHYGPKVDVPVSKLYFNAKDIPDSYPLIAFTAATNGSALMQANAAHSISSVNVYTGDELNVSAILRSDKDIENNVDDDPDIMKEIYQSEEWFITNVANLNDEKLKLQDRKLVTYSNTTVIPSQEDLEKELRYRYGLVSQYSFNASLDVYGCSDIEPGQMIEIYIYLGDGKRSGDSVSKELESSPTGYIGNITMHHSSGRYFVNKITDTISGGKYVSSLNVLKLNQGTLESMIGDLSNVETYEIKVEKPADPKDLETSNYNEYNVFMNLKKS